MEFTSQIGSPGLGMSPVAMSRLPLATEGEATSGPPDVVNEREIETATFGGDGMGFDPTQLKLPQFDEPIGMQLPTWGEW